jgi:hypothetical protein
VEGHEYLGERPPPSIDPTLRTSENLIREIAALKELIDSKIEALDLKMGGHVGLDEERFRKIEERFNLIERQRLEQKSDTGTSISTALEAQKSQTNAIGGRVDDLKERVAKIESAKQGAVESRDEGRAGMSAVLAVVGAVVAVIVVVLALYAAFHTKQPVIVNPTP